MKKYVVRLEGGEHVALEQIVRSGKRAALTIRHANILLAVDESDAGAKLSDIQAAQAFGVAVRSIESLRKRLVEEGLESALVRKPQVRPSVERMFDGFDEKSKQLETARRARRDGAYARAMRVCVTSPLPPARPA